MLKYVLLLFACCFLHTLSAQPTYPKCYYDCKWMMGYDSNLLDSVGCGSLFDFSDPENTAIVQVNKKMHLDFTSAGICDENGNLQFYTNGCYIAGADHQKLQNGDGLNPVYLDPSCSLGYGYNGQQGTLALPFPAHPKQYFLIHKGIDFFSLVDDYRLHCKLLYRTLIDMNLNGGKGAVVFKNDTIGTDTLSFGQLTACKHANGRDWWILSARYRTNKFYRYLLSPEGVKLYGVQSYGLSAVNVSEDYSSQAVFSPDGSKYVRNTAGGISIYDFDRCSGLLSNQKYIFLYPTDPVSLGGAAISSNSRFLYISTSYRLYQFDLQAADIAASKTLIGEQQYSDLDFYHQQLAPDGRIYMIPSSSVAELHTIEQPNLKGDSCDFRQSSITMPCLNAFSIPNIPNFRLGRLVGSSCDTLATAIAEVTSPEGLRIYPNPASDELTVEYAKPISGSDVEIYISNMLGVAVKQQKYRSGAEKINVENLPKGIYILSLQQQRRIIASQKIIIL